MGSVPGDNAVAATPPVTVTTVLSAFLQATPGVTDAVLVSSDGFMLADVSTSTQREVEQLAAVVSGLTSLTHGAADLYRLGTVRQLLVELTGGYLFIMSTADGSSVAAVTGPGVDLGSVGYELTMVTARIGRLLTPDVVDALKNAVGPTR